MRSEVVAQGAKANVISQVGVTAWKLRDLHALAKIEFSTGRPGELFPQPRLQSLPVEFFTLADWSGVAAHDASFAVARYS